MSSELVVASQGACLVRIADEPFLFLPEKQALCTITLDAATLWPSIESGLLHEIVANPEQNDVLRIVTDLFSVGAVETLSSKEGAVPVVATETLAFGETSILVTFPDEYLRHDMMRAFSHLRIAPCPVDEYVMVLKGDQDVGVARRDETALWSSEVASVPLLKIMITQAILDQLSGLALHAGTIVRHGKSMLLLGEPGTGKSTLSLWLDGNGFMITGDDIAELDLDGTLRAIPFPVTLKKGAWKFFADRHFASTDIRTYIRPDGKHARYLPIDTTAAGIPREVAWIVLLDRKFNVEPKIEALTPAETLSALIASAWSGESDLTTEEFESLSICINGAKCARLTYSDLEAAGIALRKFSDGE